MLIGIIRRVDVARECDNFRDRADFNLPIGTIDFLQKAFFVDLCKIGAHALEAHRPLPRC